MSVFVLNYILEFFMIFLAPVIDVYSYIPVTLVFGHPDAGCFLNVVGVPH
jgi:hypothetical protein